MTRTRLLFVIRCFALVVPPLFIGQLARASDGNELSAIGAIQSGSAGAGIASPQDTTWVLLNPAGMVELGKRLDITFELLFLERGMTPAGFPLAANPLAGHQQDNSPIEIPSFGMTIPLDDSDSLGFGIFGVQGNNTKYHRPRSVPGYLGNGDRRSELQVAKMPLAYAHQFDNGWTVGGSILGIATEFRTDSLTLRLHETEGDWRRDYALGIGFQIGVCKQWQDFSFAASYTSRQSIGQYRKYSDVVKWNLDQPQKFQIGAAYRPTDKLEFVADYKWVDWYPIKQLSEKTSKNGLGWRNQSIVKVGATYKLNETWTLRAGLAHGNSAIPDEFIFANALTPALGENHLGLGFTYAVNANLEYSFAYRHCFREEQADNGRGDIFSKLGRGSKANYEENGFIVQYSYKW